MEIRVLLVFFNPLEDTRYEDGRGDGIEEAVEKNALRGPPAAGCPLSHSQQW